MTSLLGKRPLGREENNKSIALSDSDDDSTEHDGSSDEKDDGSVDSAKAKNEESKDQKGEKKSEEEVLLQTTKRQRFFKPFTEELLTDRDGLRRIYEEFPRQCKYVARGSEAVYLSRLLGLYKEWSFQLHPGIAFNDVLRKTEALGSRARVRVELAKLRDIERDRYIVRYTSSFYITSTDFVLSTG
jgi:hypothetical protein